ncbi:MAG TPA: LytR C-terminal domain-containing protein [Gaiellales bacterium]|nr:LytR C-terminal domain-containing protein [Gaiellales bacterium]
MARMETRDRRSDGTDLEGEEHLDDWFTRRLQSQGIPSRLGGTPTSRMLAVGGLALALLAFLWALSSVGSHASSSSGSPATTPVTTPAPPANGGGGGGNGGSSKQHSTMTWKSVTIDVLNGFGGQGAAASAATQLSQKGWKVGVTGNASGISSTEVVYLPGHRKEALIVAKKLGLGTPVAIAQATGVPADATKGVAIVLGPDQLSHATL